jgi:hypothetical protein
VYTRPRARASCRELGACQDHVHTTNKCWKRALDVDLPGSTKHRGSHLQRRLTLIRVRVARQTTSLPCSRLDSRLDPQAIAAAEQHIVRAHTQFPQSAMKTEAFTYHGACAASETISTTAIETVKTTSSPQVATQATTRTPAQSHNHSAAILCTSGAQTSSRSLAVSSLATHLASKDTAPPL